MLKRFSSFTLDPDNECVWRGETRIQLSPKAYAVLAYLVGNPGRIVTKGEIIEHVWPDTFVQESVLKTCILDIRKALGETAKDSGHIATVHRRGYRFVSELGDSSLPAPARENPIARREESFIGREDDFQVLEKCWERAAAGDRQVVFVTGEAGIGKTTLIAGFLSHIGRSDPVRVLQGQCIEHFGPSEAYYPVFEALSRGIKDGTAPGLVDKLRKYAPTWLVQMPGIATPADLRELKQQTVGATQERMLREMSEAVEAVAEDEPLLMVIEDVHWSDVSTVDLISMIANRTAKATDSESHGG